MSRPSTIRLREDLDEWLRAHAEQLNRTHTQVFNDALEHYKEYYESRTSEFFDSVVV
jgi:predicted transcriptional regulator